MPRYGTSDREHPTSLGVVLCHGRATAAIPLSGWFLTLSELASAPLTQQTVRVVAE
jgi:hypothetical protein